MFLLVVLPWPPPVAFACVQHCCRVTAAEARALCQCQHKCWCKCKCTLLSSSPFACVSALCFPWSRPEHLRKEVVLGAAWSPLQVLEFLREAGKRLAKKDCNWANNPNNLKLQRWLGNLKGRLLLVEPTLSTGLDLMTGVTHTNSHPKAFIWHELLLFSLHCPLHPLAKQLFCIKSSVQSFTKSFLI